MLKVLQLLERTPMTLPIHAVGLQSLVKDMLLATDTVQVSHTHAALTLPTVPEIILMKHQL